MTLSISELEALCSLHVRDPIPADMLQRAITSPPFISSRSLINIRDLGAVPGSRLAKGRFYRSGTLDEAGQDPEAVAWLAAHIKRIFDLRRGPERGRNPSPVVPGVENVWYDLAGRYTTPPLEEFAVGEGDAAWRHQYLTVTRVYKPTIRAVLENVRDRPTEPFLFHCTAGRDRTGVVAGLLQSLAGTPPDRVVFDYMLSRIGTDVAREKLTAFAVASLNITDPETPGFWNLVSLKPSYWNAFVEGLQEEYGGFDGYVTTGMGFSEADLEIIKGNLRA
ncbi:protein-tyrosine phosphatase-like protein [Dactylonectria estremocensis]|uniref:Protein-tyrosine phosphatase-like protein n=1 Tax=Dactylonectria estremocensis TaxID=1079267 RepID=A0A9P9J4E3_9HYPO|nr:protein-tyrosine phosphatase-like protein [Dactylonectria estremocensis]